jgi:hypothetical protein
MTTREWWLNFILFTNNINYEHWQLQKSSHGLRKCIYLAYTALNVTFLWEMSNHCIQRGILTSFQLLGCHLCSHSCAHIAYSLLQSKQLLCSYKDDPTTLATNPTNHSEWEFNTTWSGLPVSMRWLRKYILHPVIVRLVSRTSQHKDW